MKRNLINHTTISDSSLKFLIRQGRKILRIKRTLPFEFRVWKNHNGALRGTFRSAEQKILIEVGPGAEFGRLAHIILHELVHFKQHLENPKVFSPETYSNARKMRHDNRPWEVEANYWTNKYVSRLLESFFWVVLAGGLKNDKI